MKTESSCAGNPLGRRAIRGHRSLLWDLLLLLLLLLRRVFLALFSGVGGLVPVVLSALVAIKSSAALIGLRMSFRSDVLGAGASPASIYSKIRSLHCLFAEFSDQLKNINLLSGTFSFPGPLR